MGDLLNMIEMRVAITMIQTAKGYRHGTMYRFECPRCKKLIRFYSDVGCPVVCKQCDEVLPDLRRMYEDLKERIDWHQHYLISYNGGMI